MRRIRRYLVRRAWVVREIDFECAAESETWEQSAKSPFLLLMELALTSQSEGGPSNGKD
jgi:hypothetical protein